jgi:ubiquinone/menaquinone biosynthesis C-methylase UbiE
MSESLQGTVEALRAAGEPTRLRILTLLSEAELTVTELTEILLQSQPRVSRHLKELTDAGLVERTPEGAWAFFRITDGGVHTSLVRSVLELVDRNDRVLAQDQERLDSVRDARRSAAQRYFDRHAAEWDVLRQVHVGDERVEKELLAMLGERPYRTVLDLGTGTGRILELLGPFIERGVGCDVNREMLAIARANLERAGLSHCRVRMCDMLGPDLPDGPFDVVVVHQVLHLLDAAAAAVRRAASIVAPGGRLVIVDFAPHNLEYLRTDHSHRRLGFARETIDQWMAESGLVPSRFRIVAPPEGSTGRIASSIWIGAAPAARQEVAA